MATLRQRKTKKTDNIKETKHEIISKENTNEVATPSSTLSDFDQCKQMFEFIIPHKYVLCIQLMATLGHIITRMLFPIVVGFAVSALASKSEEFMISDGIMTLLCANNLMLDCTNKHSLLNTTLKLMIFVNLSQTIFNFVRGYFGKLIGEKISAKIRNRLFRCILRNELSFFEETKSGILLNRLSSDCNQFKDFCIEFIPKVMDNVLGILLALSYTIYISPSLTVSMLVFVPIASFLSRHFSNFYGSLTQIFQNKLGKSMDIAFESITNIKTIKAHSSESKQELLFAKQIKIGYEYSSKIVFSKAMFEAFLDILTYCCIAMVLWYCSKKYSENQINAGNAVTFLITSIQISNYIKRSMNIYSDFVKNVCATKRIFELMNNEESKMMNLDSGIERGINGKIEFVHVSFCYPSRPHLKVIGDLSFSVSAGESVCIVGESGNGKTTIISLLMRLYDPQSGKILIDGIDLKEYNLKWLHQKKIGFIQQEPSLFNTGIKANICLRDDVIDMDKVIEAAKKAQCYSFIEKLHNGFDTVCGERGCQLSGGQKQRIAIARAIYNDPTILIMDEASSALDAQNEYLLHETIKNMQKERKMTIITIAHRLSSIKHADKLLVVKNGKIVQSGTHSELIERKEGEYFNLVKRQVFVE